MEMRSIPANELAVLCANASDDEAWTEFVRRFQRPIALVVLRTVRGWGEPSTAVVDDLVQETFLRLCANDCRLLRNFVPQQPDSIIGYLKVIAANAAHDHFRAQNSVKRGGELRRLEGETDGTESLASPAQQSKAFEINLQVAEIERALQMLGPELLTERDRKIFWLYYRQGYTARDIAAIPHIGLTIKGVESSIHRTTVLLRDALARPPMPPVQKGVSPSATIWKEGR